MANQKDAVSFDAIIQADRQRRKNEALANEIFGKSKKSSTPTINNAKAAKPPSLASRIGKVYYISLSHYKSRHELPERKFALVVKKANSTVLLQRSSSTTNVKPKPAITTTTNTFARNPPSRPASAAARHVRENRISSALASDNGQANIRGSGHGISIRGTAGPFVVQASNFAPGTTAADIESAMITVAGEILSCRIMASSPTVIAEMVFPEKSSADNVIATFNGQKADGRILHVYMKQGGPSQPTIPQPILSPPTGPKELLTTPSLTNSNSYTALREEADRDRRERRRAEPEVQDGRFGFESRDEDPAPAPAPAHAPAPAQYDDRNGRDDRRYNGYPRDDRRGDRPSYGGGRGGARGRGYKRGDSFRRNDDRRGLYSDEMMVDAPERDTRDTRDRPRNYR